MHLLNPPANHKRVFLLAVSLTLWLALSWSIDGDADGRAAGEPGKAESGLAPFRLNLRVEGRWEKRFDLKRGETFELSVSLPRPSLLPPHGRVGVRWVLVEEKKEVGSYTFPTADWKKVLHALDSDLYLVYRAPV